MDTYNSRTEMTAVTRYTLDDVSDIIFNGFNHELDDNVLATIKQLAEQVGAADYVRTPQFHKNGGASKSKRKSRGGQEISDTDWEAIRSFQATEIVKKVGIEAAIDKVRIYLNKITDTTFTSQKEAIFAEIQALSSLDTNKSETENNLQRISETLFAIASNNSFYSSLYAELYKDLIEKHAFLRDTLDSRLQELDSLFNNIEWCDPQTDYDRFCDVNKANDSRRAATLFYVNLMKRGLISQERIVDLTRDLQRRFLIEVEVEDKTSICEELSELINILIVNCWTPDKKCSTATRLEWIAHWRTHIFMHDTVCRVAGMKAKDYPSLSNKAVFKHMDIRDAINKLMSES